MAVLRVFHYVINTRILTRVALGHATLRCPGDGPTRRVQPSITVTTTENLTSKQEWLPRYVRGTRISYVVWNGPECCK